MPVKPGGQADQIGKPGEVPVHLLRFGGQGGDDPTKRRDFGKAMTLALIPLPSQAKPDEATAPALMVITGAQRRLDATTPAKDLARGVAAHVAVTNTHREYDDLLAHAVAVHELPFRESTPESHMAASRMMIDSGDELFAVWDGKPARAYGGTADVVVYARRRGLPVRVIWPEDARRD